MLIDSYDIAVRNDQTIRESPSVRRDIACANACIETLRSAAYLPLNELDHITILRLGVRLINSAGSAGITLLNGYYQPAASHIRDVIEVSFLLDLFRRDEREIRAWRDASDEELWKSFRPQKLKSRLDHLDGGKQSYRKNAYKFYSEHGTHTNPQAFALISPDFQTVVGPFADADLLTGLSFDLTRHLAAGTGYLVRYISNADLDRDIPKVHRFLQAAAIFFETLDSFKADVAKRTD